MPFEPTSTLPRPADDVVDVELDGERVIYRPSTDRVAKLDQVGSMVWTFLDGTGTIADLGADVADAFGVDPASATADLLVLLDDLGQQGFFAGTGEPRGRDDDRIEPGFLADPPSP